LDIAKQNNEHELKEIFKLEKDSTTINSELNILKTNSKNLNNQLIIEKQELSIMENAMTLHKLKHAIDICTKAALEQDSCPVCSQKIRQDILKNKKTPENIQVISPEKYENKKERVTELETEIKLSNISLNKAKDNSILYKKNLSSLYKKYLDENNISSSIQKHEELFKWTENNYREEKNLLERKLNEITAYLKILTPQFHRTNGLQESLAVRKKELARSEKDLNAFGKQLNQYTQESTELLEQISTLIPKLSANELKILPGNFEQLQNNYFKRRELKQEQISLNERIKDTQSRCLNLQKDIKKSELQVDSLNNEFKSCEDERDELLNGLLGNKPGLIIQQMEKELKGHLTIINKIKEEYYEIGRKKDVISGQIELKKDKLKQINDQLTHTQFELSKLNFDVYSNDSFSKFGNKLKDRKSTPFNYEEIQNLTSILDTLLLPISEKISEEILMTRDLTIELKTQLNNYQAKVDELNKYAHTIKGLRTKLSRQQNLLQALGKDEFGRFAAAIIERQLIQLCNKELESLCDSRYELVQKEKNKTNGPEFFVIDHWKDGNLRNISTLSGGETFLVSLAMALGLAEMTRGKVEINSFFIDEGFGTLDDESIDEVLNILLTIRSRGKQIGIISHVTSLTDRIPTRIHLEKDQWGESQVRYVQN